MKNRILAALLVASLLPTVAHADGLGQKGWGAVLTLSGGLLMIGAFNYNEDCPSGYSTHTFQDYPTQCVYVSTRTYNTDVTEAPINATYRRPAMMWAGVGALGTGLLLLVLPTRASKHVDVSITPKGVAASAKVRF